MINLLDFKRNAESHNVCGKYKQKWDKAENLEELMKVALDIQGIEYLSKSISEGWGLSPEYISHHFRKYINGEYLHTSEKGYTSEMICNFQGEVTIKATNTILIDSECIVNIPQGHLCNLYVTGKSSIVIFNEDGYAHVIQYGDTSVEIQGNGNTHITKAQ